MEYQKQPLTKYELLMTNGIFTVIKEKDHFIQHNDYFEHKTFFQCPKCKSLNVDAERAYGDNTPVIVIRSCDDCGYKHTMDLNKED
jgi:transcription elongation factor Elf1